MIVRYFIGALAFILHTTLYACMQPAPAIRDIDLEKNPIIANFKPDIHVTHKITQDETTLQKIRKLFFETDNTANPKREVYTNAVRKHGGQEIILLTDDNVRISALYFKRPHAKINLIYIPGYFFDLTPTKEWGAPFALLFEDFNILIIDSRGTGDSEGIVSLFRKNAYGAHAYPDIQAALEFMHKENGNSNILAGFCFGAAMVLHATVEAQKAGKPIADGLILNCMFSKFENMFNRATAAEDRFFYRFFVLKSGFARWAVESLCNGSLFSINPIDLIKDITIPCYFEHFAYDQFAILQEGISVFNAARCPKMFTRFDEGRHVRMQGKVPFQYAEACKEFLYRFNFLPRPTEPTLFQPSSPQVPVAT